MSPPGRLSLRLALLVGALGALLAVMKVLPLAYGKDLQEDKAPVFETVPSRRTEFSWLNARGLRNGAISAIIERRRGGRQGAPKRIAKSLGLLAASPWRSLRLGIGAGSATIGLYHCQVAIGRLMAEFGRVNEQYRQAERN